MNRNRRSAKAAGARFERLIADYLRDNLDDRIDRKVRTGAKDTGDIANVRDSHNRRITLECKDTTRTDLPGWLREAHTERDNAGDYAGLIIHKRRGTTNPAQQWVTTDLATLTALLTAPHTP